MRLATFTTFILVRLHAAQIDGPDNGPGREGQVRGLFARQADLGSRGFYYGGRNASLVGRSVDVKRKQRMLNGAR